MSTEPMTNSPADTVAGSERGLLVAMLLMVLFGVIGMLAISS
jgi:hypothetical protein